MHRHQESGRLSKKFYLYLNMTKPKEHLILSYSRVDSEGKAIRPSYLIGQIKKMYPQIKVQEAFDRSMTIATPKSSMSYFLQGLLAQREQHGLHMEETAGKDWGGFSALVFRKQRLGRTDLSSDRCFLYAVPCEKSCREI